MLLLIDNYDSFTYNLVQRIGELDSAIEMRVVRNDKITIDEAVALNPSHLLLSPGPCTPKETGVCPQLIEHFRGRIPILGVCLGHQAIAQTYGGNVVRAFEPMHGKLSTIHHTDQGLFKGLPSRFDITRYHSLVVEKKSLPSCFEITAETDDGVIMGLQHKTHPVHGVQFHPESIASQFGHALLANFLELAGLSPDRSAIPAPPKAA